MKHRLLYLALFAGLAYTNIASAQDDCTDQYWGSQSRYPYPQSVKTPIPNEYTPLFINYIGRNGSSHLQNTDAIVSMYKLIQKADSAHALKDDGKKLLDMLLLVEKLEKPKLGTLTQSGINEMKDIGSRLYVNYQPAFKPGSCIKVSAVNDPRMLQSVDALFAGMGRSVETPGCEKIDLKDIDNLQPLTVGPVLQNFAEKGDWKDYADDYVESKKPKNFNAKFLGRFFQTAFLEDVDEDVKSKFIADMYKVALVTRSIDREVTAAGLPLSEVDIRSFFSCSEFELYANGASTGEFYKSAAGNDKEGIQIKSSIPLFINFLTSTDAYSMGQTVAADIRLASFESVASLATLLEFKGYNKVSKDALSVQSVWKAEEVIPMAANIQLVFYKGTTADTRSYFLVKFLLNENEMEIEGLKAKSFPYYLWDDVKKFYYKKLNEVMEIEKINDDKRVYLLNLKP